MRMASVVADAAHAAQHARRLNQSGGVQHPVGYSRSLTQWVLTLAKRCVQSIESTTRRVALCYPAVIADFDMSAPYAFVDMNPTDRQPIESASGHRARVKRTTAH